MHRSLHVGRVALAGVVEAMACTGEHGSDSVQLAPGCCDSGGSGGPPNQSGMGARGRARAAGRMPRPITLHAAPRRLCQDTSPGRNAGACCAHSPLETRHERHPVHDYRIPVLKTQSSSPSPALELRGRSSATDRSHGFVGLSEWIEDTAPVRPRNDLVRGPKPGGCIEARNRLVDRASAATDSRRDLVA